VGASARVGARNGRLVDFMTSSCTPLPHSTQERTTRTRSAPMQDIVGPHSDPDQPDEWMRGRREIFWEAETDPVTGNNPIVGECAGWGAWFGGRATLALLPTPPLSAGRSAPSAASSAVLKRIWSAFKMRCLQWRLVPRPLSCLRLPTPVAWLCGDLQYSNPQFRRELFRGIVQKMV
jgi:hypothetical protein